MHYYNQHFIDRIGEDYLNKKFFQQGYQNLDLENLSFEKTSKNFILQHYLVKLITTGKYSSTCQQYLNQFYHDFFQKPWKYVNSPLIRSEVIKKVYGQQATKVIAFRDKYYSGKNVHNIYLESKKRNLTLSEKYQLYSYYIRHLDTNNKNLQEIIREEIKKIIDSKKDIKEFTIPELQFYCQYLANTTPTKPTVLIGEEKGNLHGEENYNLITINRKYSNYSIELLTKTVFHESRHALQEVESKNKETSAAYEMAQFLLFHKYVNTNDYNSYHENYKFSSIELDAEKDGYYRAQLFLYKFNRKDLYNNIIIERKKNVDKRDYYAFMLNENKMPISVDKFVVENMDKIIKNNPQEIQVYPVLKHFYYDNGQKKPFITILEQRQKITECKEVYEYYINYGIRSNELESIDLNKLDKKTISNITSVLISNYRFDNICKVKDYLDDEKTYISNRSEFTSKQIQTTTNYKLMLATKILSFINRNFDILVSSNNEKLSNVHPLYNFLYDFRDFDPNLISNEVLKNSPSFYTRLNEYKAIYNKVMEKFNKRYIIQHLESLEESDRHKLIQVDDKKITFEKLMLFYIAPHMDTHQRISIGSNQVYVSDIFYRVKNKEKNKQLESMFTEEEKNSILKEIGVIK